MGSNEKYNKGYIITDMELGDDLNNIILMYEEYPYNKIKSDIKDGNFGILTEDKGTKSS